MSLISDFLDWIHIDDEPCAAEEDFDNESKKPTKSKHKLEMPRKRSMNNDDKDDFVAIDFETMTSLKTSACAIGLVKVIDGEIVQQFYSLINPVRDEYTDKEPNISIHGISLSEAEKANTFAELFEGLRLFIDGYPLVCHNKAADIAIINALMDYYGLTGIDTDSAICTYKLTGKSLSKCCEELGIKEERHHNALWDAEICARIYLNLIGKPYIDKGGGTYLRKTLDFKGREIDASHRQRLNEEQIKNKNTIFYGSTVVITGVFDSYSDRDSLAADLQSLGAKISSSISKKTTHVLVGENAGPKKIEKIKQLQDEGYEIKIIRENELAELLK